MKLSALVLLTVAALSSATAQIIPTPASCDGIATSSFTADQAAAKTEQVRLELRQHAGNQGLMDAYLCWQLAAASKGNLEAMHWVGSSYIDSYRFPNNKKQGWELLIAAARRLYPPSMWRIALEIEFAIHDAGFSRDLPLANKLRTYVLEHVPTAEREENLKSYRDLSAIQAQIEKVERDTDREIAAIRRRAEQAARARDSDPQAWRRAQAEKDRLFQLDVQDRWAAHWREVDAQKQPQ